jgi:hypothetical protein
MPYDRSKSVKEIAKGCFGIIYYEEYKGSGNSNK